MHVSLREKNGELGIGLNLHYGDLDLAAVPKKERAVVLVGPKAGRHGTVTVRILIFAIFFPLTYPALVDSSMTTQQLLRELLFFFFFLTESGGQGGGD